MKNNLIILSDIYGLSEQDWINNYVEALKPNYKITLFDSCQLAGLSTELDKEKRHQAFVNGGIEKAVQSLNSKVTTDTAILGFSIGGTIAWRAALQNPKIKQLVLLSATRLRYETSKPNIPIRLYYGKKDQFKPQEDWFQQLDLKSTIIRKAQHEFYRENRAIALILSLL